VELFIIAGCSANRRDIQGHAALHVASWARDVAGAALEGKDNLGCTALQCAANMNHARNVEYPLSVGADIETRDGNHETPLFETVRYGNCEALQVLLDHGARVDYTNGLGHTVLHIAAAYGNIEAVQPLQRRWLIGLNGVETDWNGRTAMDIFAERVNPPEGLAEALRDLIDNVTSLQRGQEDASGSDEENFSDAAEYLET
jgi:hypothetical protein